MRAEVTSGEAAPGQPNRSRWVSGHLGTGQRLQGTWDWGRICFVRWDTLQTVDALKEARRGRGEDTAGGRGRCLRGQRGRIWGHISIQWDQGRRCQRILRPLLGGQEAFLPPVCLRHGSPGDPGTDPCPAWASTHSPATTLRVEPATLVHPRSPVRPDAEEPLLDCSPPAPFSA